MEKRYVGSSKELNNAKSRGLSVKVRRFLAAALIGGNLIAIGHPMEANAYTDEQLSTHQRHVQELKAQYSNIYQKSNLYLNDLLKRGEISEEIYSKGINAIKLLQENERERVSKLQRKINQYSR